MPVYFAVKEDKRPAAPGSIGMGTVIYATCGERFWIEHPVTFADKNLAAKQAEWLAKMLAYDHERQRPHADTIALP